MSQTYRKEPEELCENCYVEPGISNIGDFLLCKKCLKKQKKVNRRGHSGDQVRDSGLPEQN